MRMVVSYFADCGLWTVSRTLLCVGKHHTTVSASLSSSTSGGIESIEISARSGKSVRLSVFREDQVSQMLQRGVAFVNEKQV